MDGGAASNRPYGEQEGEVAPPGWYPDPYGDPVLRRWDGERWTLEGKPWPSPDIELAPFNWPALAAALASAGFVAFFFFGLEGDSTVWIERPDGSTEVRGVRPGENESLAAIWMLSPLLMVVFGLLGARRRYSKGPGYVVAIVLAVVGLGLVMLFLWLGLMLAEIA